MDSELKALQANDTWFFVPLPHSKKAMDSTSFMEWTSWTSQQDFCLIESGMHLVFPTWRSCVREHFNVGCFF